ncbi:MAG: ABC transporter substrate-binding protein [Candidatus Devosia euplotis]|nr:ABC transporter substrate-binding protein [Candidatus Devosia euplotis]
MTKGWRNNPDLPVITAWHVETPAPAEIATMVRNPYYYAVDQEGNQLPYIDRIEHRLFQDPEMLNLMVAQGQIDMQARYMGLDNYAFYKENEARGGYHVVAGRDSNVWPIVPNLTVKDDGLAALFQNADFRHAMSVAVGHEAIIELTQSGFAFPIQAAPVNGSPYYNADLTSHWTEYNPEEAETLLDAVGLTKRDNAGFRLRPDGQRLSPMIEANDAAHAKTLELLAGIFADVGIELLPRFIDRTQWDNNRDNNDFQLQWIPFDRLTYVPADPRLMLGSQSYGNEYFKLYQTDGESGIAPPEGSDVSAMFAAWGRASQALTLEDADAAVNEMIADFVDAGYVIGVYGGGAAVNIVSDKMHNVQPDLVQDDIFRGIGIARPGFSSQNLDQQAPTWVVRGGFQHDRLHRPTRLTGDPDAPVRLICLVRDHPVAV